MSLRYREGLKRKTVGNNLERLLFGYLETLWLYYALIFRTLTATVRDEVWNRRRFEQLFHMCTQGCFFASFTFLMTFTNTKQK